MCTFLFISIQNHTQGNLNLEFQKPLIWGKMLQFIKEKQNTFDGLLLDWQLQVEAEGGDYSSAALAQELRVLATQGGLIDLPILLCSAQDDFKAKYYKDSTSHKLFDLVYSKDDLKKDHAQLEFIALAEGYKRLNNTSKTAQTTLAISPEDYARLDVRFQAEFERFFTLKSPEIGRAHV